MRRFMVVLLVLGTWAVAWPRAAGGEDEAKKLEGTWQAVAGELAGEKVPDHLTKATRLVLQGGRYSVTVGEEKDEGMVKLVPGEKFKGMDITSDKGPNKGRTFPAIYELTGDRLKICYALEGNVRPTEFKTRPKTKLFLMTYQREKK